MITIMVMDVHTMTMISQACLQIKKMDGCHRLNEFEFECEKILCANLTHRSRAGMNVVMDGPLRCVVNARRELRR